MIPNNFSSIVGANFELLAALNQSKKDGILLGKLLGLFQRI